VSLVNLPSALIDALLTALLVILVLHPIAAGLAFIAMFFSLFLASHAITIVALIFTLISAMLTTLVWAVDLALVVTLKDNLDTLSGFDLEVDFGNAVWLVLVALLCIWTALILLSARACYCCGIRRQA
jgi:hypothetical protein